MSLKLRKQTKTTHSSKDGLQREFYLFDASKEPIGRLASQASRILMGKHRADYSASVNMGAVVVIINASQSVLTGKKAQKKNYFRYSGYMGGLGIRSFPEQMAKDPTYPLMHAIRGMLPKNRHRDLRSHQLLHIFEGDHNLPNKMIIAN
jgi:large subunit ribosomal protein L13